MGGGKFNNHGVKDVHRFMGLGGGGKFNNHGVKDVHRFMGGGGKFNNHAVKDVHRFKYNIVNPAYVLVGNVVCMKIGIMTTSRKLVILIVNLERPGQAGDICGAP